ncbi:TIGR04197 family type VII secretion effector [Gracilibacillus kekensis]|uniref:Type VII secretion effector, SACOL2603 family n=1 Tax=Gracilibacillus kekensis TaxID=1027249 RepID=A0A1M7JPI8_9BACI|nr:TIGR04197 family type VII secretion effector [Gracilibacillus kekensis]SHM54906.1 type VII secretion effector, SACOL2603 family [Gracilibacillus kekensis]
MTKEVSINMNVFRSNISNLRTSEGKLEGNIKNDWTFDKTNITPFTNDLENTLRTMELLKRYVEMLENDIITLQSIGEKIQETDENLGNQIDSAKFAPEPIR